MEQIIVIRSQDKKKPIRINEGREKGNSRNISTPRPTPEPAPQSVPKK